MQNSISYNIKSSYFFFFFLVSALWNEIHLLPLFNFSFESRFLVILRLKGERNLLILLTRIYIVKSLLRNWFLQLMKGIFNAFSPLPVAEVISDNWFKNEISYYHRSLESDQGWCICRVIFLNWCSIIKKPLTNFQASQGRNLQFKKTSIQKK